MKQIVQQTCWSKVGDCCCLQNYVTLLLLPWLLRTAASVAWCDRVATSWQAPFAEVWMRELTPGHIKL